MTKEQIIADLDYASQIAKDGAHTPLLGGPIGLMWGIMITLIFAAQWVILNQILPVPEQALLFIWAAFAVIGGTGSVLMGRRIDDKPGANSVANRVDMYVWIMFAAMMATLAFGIILNLWLQNGSFELWNIMVVVGFAGQGLAYGVVAKMSGARWVHMAALGSFIASAVCFSAFSSSYFYLMASLGATITVIIPSLITMKRAA